MSGTIIRTKCSNCGESYVTLSCPTCGRREPLARPSGSELLTLDTICNAPAFAVFRGPAVDPGPLSWALFDLEGCTRGDADEATARAGVEVFDRSPLRDDEGCAGLAKANGEPYDDLDAALAFLRSGGALCKVPDDEGSKFFRLLVVGTEVRP